MSSNDETTKPIPSESASPAPIQSNDVAPVNKKEVVSDKALPSDKGSLTDSSGTEETKQPIESKKEQLAATKLESTSDVEEREPLVTKENTGTSSAAVWGWGSWASVVTVLQEAQKTAVDAASGVFEQLEAEAREMELEAKRNADSQESEKIDSKEDKASEKDETDGSQASKQKVPEKVVTVTSDSVESGQQSKVKTGTEVVEEGGTNMDDDSKDFLLGQGLKSLDESVESMASGALQALGSAWKGGLTLMQTLEHSAGTLAHTIQEGSSPNLLESGRGLAERSLRVLEYVGKETINVIAQETGIELEDEPEKVEKEPEEAVEEYVEEEVTYDHCFYIYGGPEHMEELEALSSHHTLLSTRARAKMSDEERLAMDSLVEELQKSLLLRPPENSGNVDVPDGMVGGKDEWPLPDGAEERVSMRQSSISTAKEMASGNTSGLSGLSSVEMTKRTTERLESIRTEGCHRVAEVAASCVALLLQAGGSLMGGGEGGEGGEGAEGEGEGQQDAPTVNRKWPESCKQKAELLRLQGQEMATDIQLVVRSFSAGILEVKAAYDGASGTTEDGGKHKEEKDASIVAQKCVILTKEMEADGDAAVQSVQDGLKHLVYVLLSTTLKS